MGQFNNTDFFFYIPYEKKKNPETKHSGQANYPMIALSYMYISFVDTC